MTRELALAPLAVDTLTGACAPPSANGELVFAAPHEARLFGMAHSLVQAGVFDWDTFRAALILSIEEADKAQAAEARTAAQTEETEETEEAEAAEGAGRAAAHAVDLVVDRRVTHGSAPAYYSCFALALERLLAARGLIRSEALAARTHLLAARPAGHDHEHAHDGHDPVRRADAARGIDVATK